MDFIEQFPSWLLMTAFVIAAVYLITLFAAKAWFAEKRNFLHDLMKKEGKNGHG